MTAIQISTIAAPWQVDSETHVQSTGLMIPTVSLHHAKHGTEHVALLDAANGPRGVAPPNQSRYVTVSAPTPHSGASR